MLVWLDSRTCHHPSIYLEWIRLIIVSLPGVTSRPRLLCSRYGMYSQTCIVVVVTHLHPRCHRQLLSPPHRNFAGGSLAGREVVDSF